jgi:hypothetical protein
MSDDLSTTPADGILAARCRPNGKFGISVKIKRQLRIKYITPWGGGKNKKETALDSL